MSTVTVMTLETDYNMDTAVPAYSTDDDIVITILQTISLFTTLANGITICVLALVIQRDRHVEVGDKILASSLAIIALLLAIRNLLPMTPIYPSAINCRY